LTIPGLSAWISHALLVGGDFQISQQCHFFCTYAALLTGFAGELEVGICLMLEVMPYE
jgi:hypothetical protein